MEHVHNRRQKSMIKLILYSISERALSQLRLPPLDIDVS